MPLSRLLGSRTPLLGRKVCLDCEESLSTHDAVKMAEEHKSERFFMRVEPSFLARVDDGRRRQPDIPSRSEAIRRLVENALGVRRQSGEGIRPQDLTSENDG